MRLPTFLLRWHAALALVFVAAMFTGCSTFDEQQRKWIFQASIAPTPSRSSARVDGMDEVWIEHASAETGKPVRLHALWLPKPDPRAPVMLYLHGARRDVLASEHRIRNMNTLGFSVLAIDYRGFGLSTAELPSERGAAEDARAAWDWLARRYPQQDRYIFGHSLGGAIAVDLATAVDDARGLIVEGTFTSVADVFRTMRWGWLPITPLITQRFESVEKIGKVRSPVLVVHGSDDSLIRPELGRKLYERATAPKRFVLVDGGTHYSTNGVGQRLYRQALHDLFGLDA
jgi:alpha-beta hydrolase superfamily lysophospholipase